MQMMRLGLILVWVLGTIDQAPVSADDPSKTAEANVGVAGRIEGLRLPGSELQVAPLSDRRLPIMLRIVETYRHGDAFRYDLEYIGLEQGEFDLKNYLSRKDGTETDSLPSIPVKINSLLPPGHLIPHELESNLPKIGRYQFWMILATIGWLLGLLGLIAWRRHATIAEKEATRPKTFAELLAPRLAAANSGEMSTGQLAELERFVVEFWRRRLSLSNVPVNQAISQLRRHEVAGPLLVQLEQWIHAPSGPEPASQTRNKDQLAALLEPYRQFPAELEEKV
jgi:hypothetical protein